MMFSNLEIKIDASRICQGTRSEESIFPPLINHKSLNIHFFLFFSQESLEDTLNKHGLIEMGTKGKIFNSILYQVKI